MSTIQEPCPKCGKVHTQGEYKNQASGVVTPADIDCECGIALRWSVPIFKLTQSGYILRIRKDTEPAYV